MAVATAIALGSVPARADRDVDPARLGSLLEGARAALGRGDAGEAERLAREALAIDGRSALALRLAGLAAFRARRFDEARRLFADEVAREERPAGRAVADFNLAGCELELGSYADAADHYLAAARDPELRALATLNAGIAAENAGLRARAVELFHRAAAAAVERAGDSPIADDARRHLRLAEEAERADRIERAWRLARAGSASLKEGRAEESVTLLGRALAEAAAGEMTAHDRADLDYAFGHALLDVGRAVEALVAFRRAASESPRDPEFHYMVGVALDRTGQPAAAAVEFQRALDAGLLAKDAARARAYLDAARARDRPRRLTVETDIAGGYDSHYATGREALLLLSGRRSGASEGAGEIALDIEPRYLLASRPAGALFLGARLNALLYTSSDADPYSLIEGDLYLEGRFTPRDWIVLSATGEGYLQTAGVATFGPFQTGGQLALRALFLEGELLATRLRYAVTYMRALKTTPPDDFGYMTGFHHEALLSQAIYPGAWRFSLGYALGADDVGTQILPALDVLGDAGDRSLRSAFGRAGLYEPIYFIPYSYLANALALDGEGVAPGGVRLALGLRLEQRNYLDDVVIAPDPKGGYHKRRIDDRLSVDLSLSRPLGWGVSGRASLFVLLSRSNIDNQAQGTPFDYDDKSYTRVVATLELLRNF